MDEAPDVKARNTLNVDEKNVESGLSPRKISTEDRCPTSPWMVTSSVGNDTEIQLLDMKKDFKNLEAGPKDITLRFNNVKVSVSVPKWMPEFATPGVPGQTKHILKGVSGTAKTGQVLAVIGASGSGKTTLLDQLACMPIMNGGESSGDITVNGMPMTRSFFKSNCAYVHQDDRLWGALTVYENLYLASMLYAPNMDETSRKDRIEFVLTATGLQSCKNTKVGSALIKGVSGGQRRRVSIAVEIMGSPRIMFLDEPTSGLDSKSAAEIMHLMGALAKSLDVLIVSVIHQPSSRTFLAFDLTLLLSKGKVAYFGPAKSALPYFEQFGLKAPTLMNPADFLIEISNPDFTDKKQVDFLIEKWNDKWEKSLKAKQDADTESNQLLKSQSLYKSTIPWQIYILCRRMAMSYMRDPGAYIGRAVIYASMSLIFGVIYIGADTNQEHVLDLLFAIGWGMATPSYMAVMIMPVFNFEASTFEKECKNGMYAPLSYVIASSLTQIIFVMVTSTVSVIPYYWIVNVNPDGGRFITFWFLQYTFLYTIESITILASSLIPNFILALGIVVSILSNFFVFNGLFVTPDAVPWVFRWIEYISPHRYCMTGLAKLAFSGQEFSGFDTCLYACYGRTGDEVLDAVQGLSSNIDLGFVFGMLWMESVLLRAFHWYVLKDK
ncbi:hypothetical protein AAMO2058_000681200 [Amorphochlora amoebiformis]